MTTAGETSSSEKFNTPEPEDFISPRPPGAGAILLFVAGFLFFQFFLVAIGFLLVSLLPGISSKFINLAIMFSSTLLWGVGAWFWVHVRNLPMEWISIRAPGVRRWFWPSLFFMVPMALSFGGSLDMLIASMFSVQPKADPVLERLSETSMESSLLQVMVIVLAVVAAPICEELFFRGVALRSLRFRKWPFFTASLFTSLLFAAIHFKLTGFFLLFTLAMVLAMLAERTQSLLPSIVFHASHNAFVIFISFWQVAFRKPVMQPFSMMPPEVKAVSMPSVQESLASLMMSIPWFVILLGFLYFGAVPKQKLESRTP